MQPVSVPDILRLSISERLALLDAIWQSLEGEGKELPLSEAQKRELDRRIAEDEAHPEEGISWEALRATLKPAS